MVAAIFSTWVNSEGCLSQTLISFRFRHLDISNHNPTQYADPNKMLACLVEGLPNLASLDISGTNLAGTGSYESASSADSRQVNLY